MSIVIERIGRRYYLRGNTYPCKDTLKSRGCRFDGERKCWWTGKKDVAEQIKSELADAPESSRSNGDRHKVTDDTRVEAKVRYTSKSGKTRTYYQVASSRDGRRVKLTVLDGSIEFWADADAVETVKTYRPREVRVGYGRHTETHYQTLGSIRRYIERVRQAEKSGNICGACGGPMEDGGHLDHEDGHYKHYRCCDIPA